jgi:hypothetical protein
VGAVFPFILALAGVIWLFESVKAKVRRQPPPWKTHERQPATPLARGMWMSDLEMPARPPGLGWKMAWTVALTYLGLGCIAGAAALLTRALGGGNDAEIAAAIMAIAALIAVGVLASVIVEIRKSRRH